MSDCCFGVSAVNYPDPDPDPTATIVFSRQEKTARPAPVPTATVIKPAPEPSPADKRSAPSPDLADDVRPTQQQRRLSPVTTTSATTDGDKFEPPYADLDVRWDVEGKPCKPHNKYSFQRVFEIDLTDREEEITIVQIR